MSHLFDHLTELFTQGHNQSVTGLITDERFALSDRNTEAAVLIAITDKAEPSVILTQRPDTMRDHPGQVAFPGGKLDEGEDAVAAALREAEEELALSPELVRIIGTTDQYQTGTGFNVTPVVGVVPPDLELVPDPYEVASWFEAPLGIVLDADNWVRKTALWRGEKREYLEMDYAGFKIWGVTAAILFNLSLRVAYEGLVDGS